MRVPYAIQDFKAIREENQLYVDKTKYIEILENMEKYVLFLRPRRFGKTLFTSVLEYYYDTRFKDEFDTLFGGLYIGENKTKKANSYYVLKLNFSGISSEQSKIEKNFADSVRLDLKRFVKAHKLIMEINKDSYESNIILKDFLLNYESVTDKKIYLIIDEYDHFANNVLSDDREYFNHMTSKDGFVRTFYEVFKMYAGSIVERIFITGVTSITLDSLTSGFNISKNIGNLKELNEMVGFTEEEVKYLLKECEIDEKYIEILRDYYNGYLFNTKAMNKVYNSNLLMYFLSEFVRNNELPENLIDTNVISDYTKITNLFDLYDDEEDKKEIIENIVGGNELTGTIQERIGQLVISNLNIDGEKRLGFTREDFISLLYYLGLLTLSGSIYDDVNLTVPNYCISSVYTEYYLGYLYRQMNEEYTMQKEIRSAMRDVCNNDFTLYKNIIEKLLKGVANQDYIKFDEKYIKLMMYSVARYSKMYLVKTEYELEGLRADLVLLPNHTMRADNYYVFEIKYLKKKEYTEKALERERQDAIQQVTAYADSEELRNISNLRKYVVVAVNDELKVFEEIVF